MIPRKLGNIEILDSVALPNISLTLILNRMDTDFLRERLKEAEFLYRGATMVLRDLQGQINEVNSNQGKEVMFRAATREMSWQLRSKLGGYTGEWSSVEAMMPYEQATAALCRFIHTESRD